jgi:hypothetical protein
MQTASHKTNNDNRDFYSNLFLWTSWTIFQLKILKFAASQFLSNFLFVNLKMSHICGLIVAVEVKQSRVTG